MGVTYWLLGFFVDLGEDGAVFGVEEVVVAGGHEGFRRRERVK